jgi:ubiquinone/menaquinone biosynthesis C-methylase UbiE
VTGYDFNDGAGYEQLMGRWSREVGKAFLDWLQPPEKAHWLDVGCGTGILTQLIVASRNPAAVIAVDPAQSQIAHARSAAADARAEFRIADAEELPFADGSFDVVVASLVLNFLSRKERAISQMCRVARPGGLIAACVWDFAAERSPSGPLRRAIRRFGIAAPPIPGAETSTLGALTDLFEKRGLTGITATAIEVTVAFASFDDFWLSQTQRYAPTTKLIDALSRPDKQALKDAVYAELKPLPGGIGFPALANAIKGYSRA